MFIAPGREAPQDWEAVGRWLQAQGLALDRTGIRQFASGVANLNYLVSVDGRRSVLRRPPNGPAPPGAYDLERQYRVLSKLEPHFRHTPKAIAYCADAGVIGVPFLISEFRDGIAISRELPAALQDMPGIGERLSRLMVDSIGELHRIRPEHAGLDGLGRPEGFCARQVRGWRKRASLVLDAAQMDLVDAIAGWLAGHVPADRPASLLHLDYKLDNVLVAPSTLQIAGIVDWEMATLGDPLYDLVVMLVTWGQPDDHPVYLSMCCMPCEAPGWWTRRQALHAYLQRAGMTMTEADLKFYWLLALLRSFVAGAQLLALYRRESMPNASTANLAAVVAEGLAHTRRLVDEPLDW